jgi:flagellar biosynthesis GTPase FlhF
MKDKSEKPAKVVVPKPAFPLPYNGEFNNACCYALRLNNGLYTQCTGVRKGDAQFCKSCATTMQKTGADVPVYGTIQQRLAVDIFEYVDPKGRKPVAYTKVMKKYKLDEEQVMQEAAKFNINIITEHFVAPETDGVKRGRPKTTKDPKPKGPKGRPRKNKNSGVVIEGEADEDLFATLVAEANFPELKKANANEANADEANDDADDVFGSDDDDVCDDDTVVVSEDTDGNLSKKLGRTIQITTSEAAKEEAKKQKEAAKEEAKKQKEAAKEEAKKQKEAAKEEAKRQKEEQRLKEKAEKEAKLAAEKKQKEEQRLKEKAEKESEKAAKEAAKAKSSKKPAQPEEDEEPDIVKKIEFEGKKYFKSKKTGIIYDYEQEVVGKWNDVTNKIDFSDAEEEEEEYDM